MGAGPPSGSRPQNAAAPSAPPESEDKAPKGELKASRGADTAAVAIPVVPLTAIPPAPCHAIGGVPASPFPAAFAGPSVQMPAIVRPVVRPVVVATGSAAAPPLSAHTTTIRPQTVTGLSNRAASGQPPAMIAVARGVVLQPAAGSSSAAPASHSMSALDAVRRARRLAAEQKAAEQDQDDDCIVCLERAINTVLQPCGHRQMCTECCREHLAYAESRQAEPQVSDDRRFVSQTSVSFCLS